MPDHHPISHNNGSTTFNPWWRLAALTVVYLLLIFAIQELSEDTSTEIKQNKVWHEIDSLIKVYFDNLVIESDSIDYKDHEYLIKKMFTNDHTLKDKFDRVLVRIGLPDLSMTTEGDSASINSYGKNLNSFLEGVELDPDKSDTLYSMALQVDVALEWVHDTQTSTLSKIWQILSYLISISAFIFLAIRFVVSPMSRVQISTALNDSEKQMKTEYEKAETTLKSQYESKIARLETESEMKDKAASDKEEALKQNHANEIERLKTEYHERVNALESKSNALTEQETKLHSEIDSLRKDREYRERTFPLHQSSVLHDITNQFATLEYLSDKLSQSSDQSSLAQQLLFQVQKSKEMTEKSILFLSYVINDRLVKEKPDEIVEIIEDALRWPFKLGDLDGSLFLEQNFQHRHKVNADRNAVSRVIINVVLNAIEAMLRAKKTTGKIFFSTQEIKNDKGEPEELQLIIGNDGPVIPKDEWEDIFIIGNTSKVTGRNELRGIGLAMAKALMQAHKSKDSKTQGDIKVYSSFTKETRFLLTLPIVKDEKVTPDMISQTWKRIVETQFNAFNSSVDKTPGRKKDNFFVLFIDDDQQQLSQFVDMVEQLAFENIDVHCETLHDGHRAITNARKTNYDLVVCDIVLEPSSTSRDKIDGYQVLEQIRKDSPRSYLCLYSGTINKLDWNPDPIWNADVAIPKPMTMEILNILIQKAWDKKENWVNRSDSADESSTGNQRNSVESDTLKMPEGPSLAFAFIDDETNIVNLWQEKYGENPGDTFLPFSTPREFIESIEKNPAIIDEIKFIITDYKFTGDMWGDAIPEYLHNKNIDLPVFLYTHYHNPPEEKFTARLKKQVEPPDRETLLGLL